MSLVARLVPPGIAAVEMRDLGQNVPMHPQEEKFVSGSVEKRRREFALGRACARAALLQLGLADAIIGQDAARRPVWPDGMAGSITHTAGYGAALAAPAARYAGLGVDAECIGGVTENLFPRLFNARERDFLDAAGAEARARLATLLFSAKEACFKALNPATGLPLSFSAMDITLEADGFLAVISGWPNAVPGRHAVRDGLVVTAAWIAR